MDFMKLKAQASYSYSNVLTWSSDFCEVCKRKVFWSPSVKSSASFHTFSLCYIPPFVKRQWSGLSHFGHLAKGKLIQGYITCVRDIYPCGLQSLLCVVSYLGRGRASGKRLSSSLLTHPSVLCCEARRAEVKRDKSVVSQHPALDVFSSRKNKVGNKQNQNFLCGKFFQILQLIFEKKFWDFPILRFLEIYRA